MVPTSGKPEKWFDVCRWFRREFRRSATICFGIERRKEKMPRSLEITAFLAPPAGFEPVACRLGVITFGSYRVVRRASKCPQTRMNTGFFIELPVAEYLKISPNIGSFCTQIEPAIRQILDRFSAVTPNTGDSLELSYPIRSPTQMARM